MSVAFLVTHPQPTPIVEPSECSLHYVANLAQTASMCRSASRELGNDAQGGDGCDNVLEAVAPIAIQRTGLDPRSAHVAPNDRDRLEHRQRWLVVAMIGRRCFDDYRQAARFGDDVPFDPFFRTIGRVGAGMRPPKTARTEQESITALERSIWPSALRCSSKRLCRRGHTP